MIPFSLAHFSKSANTDAQGPSRSISGFRLAGAAEGVLSAAAAESAACVAELLFSSTCDDALDADCPILSNFVVFLIRTKDPRQRSTPDLLRRSEYGA